MANLSLLVDDQFPVTYDGPIPAVGTVIVISGRTPVEVTMVTFHSDTEVPVKADLIVINALTIHK